MAKTNKFAEKVYDILPYNTVVSTCYTREEFLKATEKLTSREVVNFIIEIEDNYAERALIASNKKELARLKQGLNKALAITQAFESYCKR